MILQSKCHNCGKQIRFYSFASDRWELSNHKSFTKITLKCRNCGLKDNYHINDVFAKSKIIQILSLLIFVIGTPLILFLLWDYIWTLRNVYAISVIIGLIMIPSTISIIMTRNIEFQQNTFNQNKI